MKEKNKFIRNMTDEMLEKINKEADAYLEENIEESPISRELVEKCILYNQGLYDPENDIEKHLIEKAMKKMPWKIYSS